MSDLAPSQSSDESPPHTPKNEVSPPPVSESSPSPTSSPSPPYESTLSNSPSPKSLPDAPPPDSSSLSLSTSSLSPDNSSSLSPLPSNSGTSPPSPPSDLDSPPPSDLDSSPPLPPSSLNSPLPSPPSDSDSSPPFPPSGSDSSLPSPPSNLGSSPPSPSDLGSLPTSPPFKSDSSLPSPPSDFSPPLSAPLPQHSDSPPDGSDQPASPPTESSPSSGNTSPPLSSPVQIAPSPPNESPPLSSPVQIAPSPPNESSPPSRNSPPPLSSPVQTTPSPPSGGPPVQTVTPPISKTPPSVTPSPPLPESPPDVPLSNPTPPTQKSPLKPSESAPPTSPISNRPPRSSSPSTQMSSGSSKQVSSRSSSDSSEGSGQGAVIGVTIAGVVIIALVALIFVILRRRKGKPHAFMDQYRPPDSISVKSDGYHYEQAPATGNSAHPDSYYGMKPPVPSNVGNGLADSGAIGNSKSWFTYKELMDITNGFSQQNVLGEGGFGCVYKGQLPDGREVAVKQLKAGSGQGEREFRAEVEIISRVHHRHLVSLVGYCLAEHHRLLVYEFVPNNTLEHHLHGKGMTVMDWPKRVKIAIGAAKGLAYLHEDCHPRIIHRDIKSANILLDNSFEAQVADFGLAKMSNDTHTHVSTRVMGTFGYLAPEYASSGKLTDRSDVFSFGAVLLELVTGRKPVDPSQPLGDESLVEWARPLLIRALESGDFEELVDPKIENNFKASEMFRMIEAAAACVRHSAPKRPRMVQVVRALDCEGDMQDLTNGVKFGQSTVYDSGQYSIDIRNFRRMAFGSYDYSTDYNASGEYDQRSLYSGEHRSREAPHKPPNSRKGSEPTSSEFPSSSGSESRPMNWKGCDRSSGEYHVS